MSSRPRWFFRTEPGPARLTIAALLACVFAPLPARARQNAAPAAITNAAPPTRAEFDALAGEVRHQRELIMQILRMEQDRYEFLLKLIGSGTASPPPALPVPPGSQPFAAAPTALPGKAFVDPRHADKGRAAATATISGRVSTSAGSGSPIYVYVENLRGTAPRGRAVEIKQLGKAFVPGVVAVERGTTVTFPNRDAVFHNVFSPSPTQPFDLGTYRAGDPPGKVTLRNPGVVEIYCNMHAKMRASVLVVPNALFTKAGPDGKFVLRDVPVGSRRVVAWSPDAVPSLKTIELTASGADLDLSLDAAAPAPHNNKHGQPYGSYNE